MYARTRIGGACRDGPLGRAASTRRSTRSSARRPPPPDRSFRSSQCQRAAEVGLGLRGKASSRSLVPAGIRRTSAHVRKRTGNLRAGHPGPPLTHGPACAGHPGGGWRDSACRVPSACSHPPRAQGTLRGAGSAGHVVSPCSPGRPASASCARPAAGLDHSGVPESWQVVPGRKAQPGRARRYTMSEGPVPVVTVRLQQRTARSNRS